jgi:hypothetical protein
VAAAAQEESNFLARCTSFFFPGWRPLTYTLFAGAPPASSSELLSHTPLDGSRVVSVALLRLLSPAAATVRAHVPGVRDACRC